jgi:alkyl hydroperoxide reductase subunit F
MNLQRAEKLIPGKNFTEVQLANGAVLKGKSVILSTGARWREINVPGEREYRNNGVAYCPHCDGPLFKGKRVAVIGGGNSGVEAAIDLAGVVGHVTLIEFGDSLRADAVLQRKLRSLANVSIITSGQTTEITGDGKKVNGLVYTDRTSGESKTVALEGVFIQIGLVPNTEWLKGSLNLSRFGEIEVDARGETSVPGVFAAGDCTTVPYKQIIISAGDGAKAALSAFDYLIRQSVTDDEPAAQAVARPASAGRTRAKAPGMKMSACNVNRTSKVGYCSNLLGCFSSSRYFWPVESRKGHTGDKRQLEYRTGLGCSSAVLFTSRSVCV